MVLQVSEERRNHIPYLHTYDDSFLSRKIKQENKGVKCVLGKSPDSSNPSSKKVIPQAIITATCKKKGYVWTGKYADESTSTNVARQFSQLLDYNQQ